MRAGPREIENPIVDRVMPGGRARITAVRNRAVVRVDGVGSFEVAGGTSVTYAHEAGAREEEAERWLNGTVALLLLAQRREFALHASVVNIDGRGIAVCGERGAGKSTTALRLRQRGHSLVTDDATVLRPGSPVMVHPLGHPVRVLPEAADRLGLDVAGARRTAVKLVLPPPEAKPLALAAIVVLEHSGRGSVRSAPLVGADACWAVVRHTHRGALYRPLWEAEMFEWAGRVTASVPVVSLSRPSDRWTVDEVADAVERVAR